LFPQLVREFRTSDGTLTSFSYPVSPSSDSDFSWKIANWEEGTQSQRADNLVSVLHTSPNFTHVWPAFLPCSETLNYFMVLDVLDLML
jgi:hypothetical protein